MTKLKDRTYELLVIIALLSLGGAAVAASLGRHDGIYLVNIYDSYPSSFWLLITICLVSSLSSSVIGVLIPEKPTGWVTGFIVVTLCSMMVLFIPLSNHHVLLGQWDEPNHFRFSLDILQENVPSDGNFYPVSHLLVSIFTLGSGIALEDTLLLFPIFFYIVYLANMAFAISSMTSQPRVRALVIIFSSPMLFGTYVSSFRPTYYAVVMFPLFVGYLLESRISLDAPFADRLALVLVSFFLPFLHPWAVIAPAVFVASTLVPSLLERLKIGWSEREWGRLFVSAKSVLGILLITWLAWFMSFRLFGNLSRRIYDSLVNAIQGSHSLESYLEIAERAGLSTSRLASIVLVRYGNSFIYLGIASILILILLNKDLSGSIKIHPKAWIFPFFILAFAGLSAFSMFRDLVTANPLRLSNFAVISVPLFLIPFMIWQNHRRLDSRSRSILKSPYFTAEIVLVIVVASGIGIIGAYDSPFTGQSSHQFPYAQRAGLEFITTYAVPDDSKIYSPFKGASTLSALFNTRELEELRKESSRWWIRLAPDHLGYGAEFSGENITAPAYLLVSSHEMAYYTEVWPTQGRITRNDILQLNQDSRWQKIYSSGGLVVWRQDAIR